jgi:hypothetical protein
MVKHIKARKLAHLAGSTPANTICSALSSGANIGGGNLPQSCNARPLGPQAARAALRLGTDCRSIPFFILSAFRRGYPVPRALHPPEEGVSNVRGARWRPGLARLTKRTQVDVHNVPRATLRVGRIRLGTHAFAVRHAVRHAAAYRYACGGKAVLSCSIGFGRTAFPLDSRSAPQRPGAAECLSLRDMARALSLAGWRLLVSWTGSSASDVHFLQPGHCRTVSCMPSPPPIDRWRFSTPSGGLYERWMGRAKVYMTPVHLFYATPPRSLRLDRPARCRRPFFDGGELAAWLFATCRAPGGPRPSVACLVTHSGHTAVRAPRRVPHRAPAGGCSYDKVLRPLRAA